MKTIYCLALLVNSKVNRMMMRIRIKLAAKMQIVNIRQIKSLLLKSKSKLNLKAVSTLPKWLNKLRTLEVKTYWPLILAKLKSLKST